MRIEIDTKNDTKEELAHLAKMLMSLSGSSYEKPKHTDIFSDDAPASGGMFNMFGESGAEPAQPAEPQQGVFSIFDNPSPEASEPTEEKRDLIDDLKIVPY